MMRQTLLALVCAAVSTVASAAFARPPVDALFSGVSDVTVRAATVSGPVTSDGVTKARLGSLYRDSLVVIDVQQSGGSVPGDWEAVSNAAMTAFSRSTNYTDAAILANIAEDIEDASRDKSLSAYNGAFLYEMVTNINERENGTWRTVSTYVPYLEHYATNNYKAARIANERVTDLELWRRSVTNDISGKQDLLPYPTNAIPASVLHEADPTVGLTNGTVYASGTNVTFLTHQDLSSVTNGLASTNYVNTGLSRKLDASGVNSAARVSWEGDSLVCSMGNEAVVIANGVIQSKRQNNFSWIKTSSGKTLDAALGQLLPKEDVVSPTDRADYAGKAADAQLTGIALTNRYTKAETDEKLAGKIDKIPRFSVVGTVAVTTDDGGLEDSRIKFTKEDNNVWLEDDYFTARGVSSDSSVNATDDVYAYGDGNEHRLTLKADVSMIDATNTLFSNAVNAVATRLIRDAVKDLGAGATAADIINALKAIGE